MKNKFTKIIAASLSTLVFSSSFALPSYAVRNKKSQETKPKTNNSAHKIKKPLGQIILENFLEYSKLLDLNKEQFFYNYNWTSNLEKKVEDCQNNLPFYTDILNKIVQNTNMLIINMREITWPIMDPNLIHDVRAHYDNFKRVRNNLINARTDEEKNNAIDEYIQIISFDLSDLIIRYIYD